MAAPPQSQASVHESDHRLDAIAADIDAGSLAAAEGQLRQFALSSPPSARALAMLADVCQMQGRNEEAYDWFNAALALDPQHYGVLCNLAILESRSGRADQARQLLHQAIALAPERVHAWVNLGADLEAAGQHAEARQHYERALFLAPGNALIQFNLGNVCFALGDIDTAIDAWRRTIELDPEFTDVYWSLAQALLMRGDYPAGWAAMRRRWESSEFAPHAPHFKQPQWSGESIVGKHILLWGEQGYGDEIQFARFAAHTAALGARVTLAVCREFQGLAAGIDGVSVCVDKNSPLPAADLHCPLMDLPGLFSVDENVIPSAPYLQADPERLRIWAARMPARKRLRVGLVWSSGIRRHEKTLMQAGLSKSFAPEGYAPLWSLDADFFSLQLEADCAELAIPLIDLTRQIRDFSDSAALISQLDLLITVDTAAAHLAGALGMPVWVILKHQPCWRWGATATSRWYASARLFRQKVPGDWFAPLDEVAQALRSLIENSPRLSSAMHDSGG